MTTAGKNPAGFGTETGLTLVEILIALFVFMVGVLGIFSLVPVGMDQAARTIDQRRGGVIARMALATLEGEMVPAPLYRGRASDSQDNAVRLSPAPGWEEDQWVDRFAVARAPGGGRQRRLIVANDPEWLVVAPEWDAPPGERHRIEIHEHYEGRAESGDADRLLAEGDPGWAADQWEGWTIALVSGTGAGQARRVVANGPEELAVEPDWDEPPDATTRFRIARMALDASQVVEGRTGTVLEVVDATTLETDTELGTADVSGAPHQYFLLITSGRAKGRISRLVARPAADRLEAEEVDFVADGVRPGDTYAVIGNSSGIYSWPGNAFGDTDGEQTADDPTDPASEYRHVVIFSDPGELADETLAPVRADVLVFRFYNNGVHPGRNRKAGLAHTVYLGVP